MTKTQLQSIRLYPTLFYLDVWVGNNKKEICKLFSKRYGASVDYYENELSGDQVTTIKSTSGSELKGEKRIVMNLLKFNNSIIVHELSHVLFYVSELTGIEVGYNSQEWVAYFNEYLFDEITNKSKYTKI